MTIDIAPRGPQGSYKFGLATGPIDAKRITVGGTVQQSKLLQQARPVYPPEAKAAGIQGAVRMQAIIGADGHVKNLEVLSGEPALVGAATEAVRQWVYQPTLFNGEPAEVVTHIDVNFVLSK